MAGRASLKAGLALAVLLAHGAALEWLAGRLETPPRLRPLAAPMFTRLLAPSEPPPPPVFKPNRPLSRPGIASAAIKTIAPEAGTPEPTPTFAPPEPQVAAAPAPEPAPPPSAPAAPAPPGLDSWPVDTRLNYRLGGNYRGELHGSARVQWQREGSRYQSRVEIDLTLLASLVLTSQGEVEAGGLAPRAYEELRRGKPRGVKLGEREIMFNDGRIVPKPEGGVQDTASQFVELSHRFSSGREALEVGRSVSFWMARPGAVDLWTYDIVEREILQTPKLGAVEAFRLKPRPIANPRGNITAEMWFAPSLQYLPVRIKVSMGPDVWVDLLVDHIEQR